MRPVPLAGLARLRHIARPCPSFPKSKPPSAGWSACSQGRRIARVEARRPDLRRALPLDLGQRLTGARVTGLRRRAKYGLIDTDRGDTLVFHLGMSGHWRDRPDRDSASTTISSSRPTRDGGSRSTMRGGSARSTWCRPPSSTTGRRSRRLGPSRSTLDARELKRRLARPHGARSSCCCSTSGSSPGLGNIYVCEALYRAGIHPRAGRRVDLARTARSGWCRRSTPCSPKRSRPADRRLRDFASPDGELGYFSKSFAVYDREGQAVRAAAGRSSGSSRAAARPSIARDASVDR